MGGWVGGPKPPTPKPKEVNGLMLANHTAICQLFDRCVKQHLDLQSTQGAQIRAIYLSNQSIHPSSQPASHPSIYLYPSISGDLLMYVLFDPSVFRSIGPSTRGPSLFVTSILNIPEVVFYPSFTGSVGCRGVALCKPDLSPLDSSAQQKLTSCSHNLTYDGEPYHMPDIF